MTLPNPTPPLQHRNRSGRAASLALTATTALAGLTLLAACTSEPTPIPRGPDAMKVQVLTVEPAQAATRMELAGRIVAREPVLVYALHDGLRVDRVFVEAGQAVLAGQPLVQLDSRGLRAELQQALQSRQRAAAQQAASQAQLVQAESRLQSANDEARRYAAVANSGAVSELEVRARGTALEHAQGEREAAVQALIAAQAELAGAEAAYRLASERERDSLLRAPITGIVNDRRVEVGTMVDATAGPLLRLVRTSDREFEALVDSSRLTNLRVGQAVEVRFAATGTPTPQRVVGRVRSIDLALAEDSRRGRMRVSLSNTGTGDGRQAAPLLGSAATALVQGAPLAGLQLPASALQFDPEPWVFVVDNGGRVGKRPVALSGDGSVVLAGLASGEIVVRTAAALLSPGQLVEPVVGGASASQTGSTQRNAAAGAPK
jgi:RND family efflux transporter MFP subunit